MPSPPQQLPRTSQSHLLPTRMDLLPRERQAAPGWCRDRLVPIVACSGREVAVHPAKNVAQLACSCLPGMQTDTGACAHVYCHSRSFCTACTSRPNCQGCGTARTSGARGPGCRTGSCPRTPLSPLSGSPLMNLSWQNHWDKLLPICRTQALW